MISALPPIISGLLQPTAAKPAALPAWLTKLHNQPASLDGVAFFVESNQMTFGRQQVVHDFPGRALPYVEDLGGKGRQLRLQAFVVASQENGWDYMPGRDALLAVIGSPGVHRLVHPWLGRMNVSILPCEMTETIREGGAAIFNLTLIESAGDVLPSPAAATATNTIAQAAAAHLSVISSMSASVTGAATAVQTAMNNAVGFINGGYAALVADLPVPPGVADALVSGAEAALRGQSPLTAILGQWSTPAGIVSAVVAMASGTTGLLGGLVQTAYAGLLRSGALSSLGVANNYFGGAPVAVPNLVLSPAPAAVLPSPYTARPLTPLRLIQSLAPAITWPTLPANTPTQVEAATNQAALQAAVAQVAAIEQARLSAALAYASQQDAFAVRDYVCGQLASVALTAPYAVYVQLRQLQAAVYADLTAQANASPSVVAFTPAATLPAIVLAYDLYGDASREGDILSRNTSVQNACFVPGGVPLEVLSA